MTSTLAISAPYRASTYIGKQQYHRVRLSVLVLSLALFFVSTPAQAEAPDDQKALAGLSSVKVAFDLTNGDGKQLLNQLNVIDETRQSLINKGVTPQFVLALRGPATKLVQTDPTHVKAEDRIYASQIAQKLKELQTAKGVESVEQSIAKLTSTPRPKNRSASALSPPP